MVTDRIEKWLIGNKMRVAQDFFMHPYPLYTSDPEEPLLTSWSLIDDGRGDMSSARSGSAAEAAAVVHDAMNDGLEGEEMWPTVPAEAGRRQGEADEEKTADVVVEQGVVSRDEDGLASIRRLAINFTDLYPNCTSLAYYDDSVPGDNYCNSYYNNAECGYDGGDCCECDCGTFGTSLDSSSSTSSSANFTCGANGYVCVDPASECFEDLYPDCVSRGGTLEWIGNGACYWGNNFEECGYDGGDCCECDCESTLESHCGVNGYDCADPSSPSECTEDVPTPSPQEQAPTPSPVEVTPAVSSEDGDSDDTFVRDISIGVISTVVGGVALALVTKYCLGERASSAG
ncbi:unnamed protein product [Ectocarpus sp. CCAP 1310/34]|nr:unnamed protein product [Ectocarpus sp. CCAP 1310/34]